MSCVAFASSGNWVEVTRFAGEGGGVGYSPHFMIEYVECRIRWQYSSIYGWDWDRDFSFYVEPNDNVSEGMGIASVTDPMEKNGTLNINNYIGTFHIFFPPLTSNWTVIVEQNIDSIPEFPSWIILPLFLVVTFVAILAKKRLF